MPKTAKETETRWLIPNERYGYVERNHYNMAVVRYKGYSKTLERAWNADERESILKAASVALKAMKKGAAAEQARKEAGIQKDERKSLGKAMAEFREDRQLKKGPVEARYEYESMFKKFFGGVPDFILSDSALQKHLAKRIPELEQRYSPNTLQTLTGRLNQFIRYCIYHRWITSPPWDSGLQKPKKPVRAKKVPLTDSQIFRLYLYCYRRALGRGRGSGAGVHDADCWRETAALLMLLNATGMRIGEACSLYWGDAVDDPTRTESGKGLNTIEADRIVLRDTKNGDREIPFGGDLPWPAHIRAAVERLRQIRQGAKAFRWANRKTPNKYIRRAFLAVGIIEEPVKGEGLRGALKKPKKDKAHLTSHLFRHTVEKRQMSAGVSERVVVQIVGHTEETRRAYYGTEVHAEDTLRDMARDLGL